MGIRRIILLTLLVAFSVTRTSAHTPSETRLTLFVTNATVHGQWEVAILDLQQGLKADPDRWQRLSPEQRNQQLEALAIDTITRLEIKAEGQLLTNRVTDLETLALNSGDYARVSFTASEPGGVPEVIEINPRALFGVDTNMYGLLRIEHGRGTEVASFKAGSAPWEAHLTGPSNRWAQAWTFILRGAEHIWKGPDHILFLLALLLPAVLRRDDGKWIGAEAFRPAAINIVKIVTAFTVAHSITVSLAVLGIVQVDGRIVEPIIAASVIAAAVNNIWPWFGERGWMVAFGFGLVHGLGLAGGMMEGGLHDAPLAIALVGFNAGVELGQLSIVTVFLPVAFAFRGTWGYRELTLKFGSAAVAVVAAIWMFERVFAESDSAGPAGLLPGTHPRTEEVEQR